MTEKSQRALRIGACVACVVAAVSCGPSAREVQLTQQAEELRKELSEQRQYNDDLKLRMRLLTARNKVLLDLVKGLTADPDKLPAGGGSETALLPAHTSLDSLDQDFEALVTTVQHSKADMDAVRAQRKALADQLTDAKRAIEEARAEEEKTQARADAYRAMLAKLSELIGHGELDARVVGNRMLLQLPESVLFQSNDARVTRSGKALLDRVAEVLKSVSTRQFQIAGHSDGLPIRYGEYRSNWHLSAARALNVALYLIERGVPKERLSAAAHADTEPIASEDTAAGRMKNRRIEIVLLPNLEELPDLSALGAALSAPK